VDTTRGEKTDSRLDEEFCREQFQKLLQGKLRYLPDRIYWEEVPPAHEPPDY